MRFLWKTQLKKERGKFLPQKTDGRNVPSRRERLEPKGEQSFSFLGTLFLWLLFLGTLIYVVVFSPYLALTSWEVTGLSLVPAESFQADVDQEIHHKYLSVIPRDRYLLVRPRALEQFLKERYPLIKNLVVTRIFPHTLHLTVEERNILLLWCVSDTCGHVLEDGSVREVSSVYEEEENKNHTLFLRDGSAEPLRFGSDVYDPQVVALALALPQALQERFGIETEKEMSFSSRFANELRVKTKQGWELYISTRLPLDTSLETLRLLFEKELPEDRRSGLQYIDLRTENRIFYRYQDGVVQETEEKVQSSSGETKEVSSDKKEEKKKH
jgi:cell division septal protein FtsQ